MGFTGRLEGIAPSDIFQVISQNRMTGTLIARCPDRTAMVVFQDGQVIEATSDAPQESLSHLLVSQGIMSVETIEAAQERRKLEPDKPLGAILVHMGAISEKTLESIVFRQIGHIVHRLMSCEDGFLTFDRGEGAVKRKLNTREFLLPSGVSAEYLIMERARVVDEERRTGHDRRAHPRGPAPISQPGREQAQARSSGIMPRVASWLRATAQPKLAALREAMGTTLQRGTQAVRSTAEKLKNNAAPRLRTAMDKVRAFSPDGRALIIAGIGGIIAGIALILLTTHASPPPASELLITGRLVKIRANPTTNAKVVVKVERGETVSSISFKDGWHEVRTRTGETGWIWKNLVQQKENKDAGTALGLGIWCALVLIAGVALLVTGIMRKRRFGAAAPGVPGAGG